MTGPLAQEFAQVRKVRRGIAIAASMGDAGWQRVRELIDEHDAALSVIERHVQDMEKALRFLEDFVIEHGLHDELVWKGSRAALPASGTRNRVARGKGTK